MSLTVNTNLASLNAQNAISSNQQGLTTSMQRLSTGLKINSAADNAAGYAISQRMTAQINGNTQAASNANDAISMTQTAQGDLSSITANLQQIRTLAVQAANGSNSVSDRAALNNQAQQLISEISRVASGSSFNGINLLDGSFTATNFQVGANGNSNGSITISAIPKATASALGVTVNTVDSTAVGTNAGGLAAGDLTLNGIQVGASVAGANPGQTTNSAAQIAAAINRVSAQSGITATANATTVTGSAATAFTALPSTTADLTINGVKIGNIAAGTNAIGEGANVAAAINLMSDKSGVTATANASTGQVTLTAADGSDIAIGSGFGTSGASVTGLVGSDPTSTSGGATAAGIAIAANTQGLTVNGIQIGAVAAGTDDISQGDNMAAAINLVSSQSGVTATSTAGVLTLTNTSKSGILLGSAFTGGSLVGVPSATSVVGTATTGLISLSSNSGGTITVSGNAPGSAGLSAGQKTTTSQTYTVDNVNLNTSAGAAAALSVIDGAINMTNTSASALGAYQNRFTQTVSTLNSENVNTTASRSRITDADFAAETAALSRAQVLQQAGTAMLAQANQSAQGVLSLLR